MTVVVTAGGKFLCVRAPDEDKVWRKKIEKGTEKEIPSGMLTRWEESRPR